MLTVPNICVKNKDGAQSTDRSLNVPQCPTFRYIGAQQAEIALSIRRARFAHTHKLQ
jgi:hypothetical protein